MKKSESCRLPEIWLKKSVFPSSTAITIIWGVCTTFPRVTLVIAVCQKTIIIIRHRKFRKESKINMIFFFFPAKGNRDLGSPHHSRLQGQILLRHHIPQPEDRRHPERGIPHPLTYKVPFVHQCFDRCQWRCRSLAWTTPRATTSPTSTTTTTTESSPPSGGSRSMSTRPEVRRLHSYFKQHFAS